MTSASRRRLSAPIAFALGAISGVLVIGLLRLAIETPAPVVHYHANWAIFVNGQQLDLSGDRFMEDVAACKTDTTLVLPEERVPLHNMMRARCTCTPPASLGDTSWRTWSSASVTTSW